jgi:hypothetical protein
MKTLRSFSLAALLSMTAFTVNSTQAIDLVEAKLNIADQLITEQAEAVKAITTSFSKIMTQKAQSPFSSLIQAAIAPIKNHPYMTLAAVATLGGGAYAYSKGYFGKAYNAAKAYFGKK